MAAASWQALSPTGPWPKIAIVSRPERSRRHQRARRDLHVVGVRAVGGHAIDQETRPAELRPADAAVLADPAAAIVVVHHAHADLGLGFGDARPDRGDHAAGLVAGDDRLGQIAQAQRPLRLAGCGAIELEIAAAHARRLDLEHHVARTRGRVRELPQLKLPVTQKYDAFHPCLLSSPARANRRKTTHVRTLDIETRLA
jgi:hypothetical protein